MGDLYTKKISNYPMIMSSRWWDTPQKESSERIREKSRKFQKNIFMFKRNVEKVEQLSKLASTFR